MTSQVVVDGVIENHLIDNWLNGVQVYFENQTPEQPKSEFLNYMSVTNSSSNISIGTNKTKREFCSIIGEIRVNKGDGKGRASELAEQFQLIFENKILSNLVHIFEANKNAVDGMSHYGINVEIGYWWDR